MQLNGGNVCFDAGAADAKRAAESNVMCDMSR